MKNEEKELYQIIDRIVSETPIVDFTKTIRGLKTKKLEFTFCTDLDHDDNCVVVIGKQSHCVRSPKIRQRLLEIYHG